VSYFTEPQLLGRYNKQKRAIVYIFLKLSSILLCGAALPLPTAHAPAVFVIRAKLKAPAH
jgi:hypothetical protein